MKELGKMLKIIILPVIIVLILTDCKEPGNGSNIKRPPAPTGLFSSSQTETSVALEWDTVAGASKYHIYTGTTSENLTLHSSAYSTFSLISSLTPNTTYYFAISAENKAGEGKMSSFIIVKTNQQLPSTPTGLVSITHTETTIALAWDYVVGASKYNVYIGTISGDLTLHSSFNSTSCLLSSLTPNVTYYIEVSAENEAGESDRSLPVTVTTNHSVKPASPLGLKAETITINSIDISWNEVTGVLSYKIFTGTSQTALTLRGTSTSTNFQIISLNPNTGYFIAVSAVTATSESDQCIPINVTTKPAAPFGLTAEAVSSNYIYVSWTGMSGVSGYVVYAGTSSGNMTQRGTPTSNYFSITELNPNTEYFIAVSAKNVSGESAQTSPLRITTLLPAPSGLIAEPVLPSTIRISWNAVNGAGSYKIYRSTSLTGSFINIDTVTTTSYNDTGRLLSTTYYYRVSAINSGNIEGVQSALVSTSIPSQTKAITQFRIGIFSVNGTITGTNINITVPNIVNLTTLIPTITHNGRSVSPASGTAMDFSTPKQYMVTAEDNTTQNYTVTVTPSNTTLATAFTWINNNYNYGETYTIVAMANESINPTSFSLYSSTNIILNGGTTEKTISLNSNGSLFTIEGGTLTLGNNITLQGRSDNNASLVKLNSGNLVMNTGSKIVNNTLLAANNNNADGGGVNVNNSYSTFTMNGGTISGNRVQAGTSGSYTNTVRARGGGVYNNNGTFNMNGGTITGNTAYSAYYACAGGGVYVDNYGKFTLTNGTISNNTAQSSSILAVSYAYGGGVAAWTYYSFIMQGGTISGNTVSSADNRLGGGVYVLNDTFRKTGGTIYGSNATEAQKNTAKDNNSGHAVYAEVSSTILRRNNTAGTTVNLDSSRSGSAGGWE